LEQEEDEGEVRFGPLLLVSGHALSDDRIALGTEVTGEEHNLMGLALLQVFSIGFGFIALVVVVLVVGSILYSAVKVIKEYERGV